MIMTHVYIVQHLRELPDGGESVKFIGVYSTELAALRAVKQLRGIEGFKDFPGGFSTDRYEVDKTFWTEGFVTV